MTYKLDRTAVAQMIPKVDDWFPHMEKLFEQYEINTPLRVAGFMAQCAYESSNFTRITENLNYSAEGLNKVFPKYFIRAGRNAADYHRKPEKIANIVYANRIGNGDTASGDGWTYRGRGVIQLTGKANYQEFAKDINKPLSATVKYLETNEGALHSACWFWSTRNLNRPADKQDIVTMTKLINGGTHGLDGRKQNYAKALKLFR